MEGTVDLELVPAFVAVVRGQSFTKAAEELGVPKSTISRRIARLEEQLGVPLVARSTRSMRLTDAGEAYYARVLPALEEGPVFEHVAATLGDRLYEHCAAR